MKRLPLLAVSLLALSVFPSFGQGFSAPGAANPAVDAGYNTYDPSAFGESQGGQGAVAPQRNPEPMPQAGASSASVINEMGKLDNARAIEAGDRISFRIVEEGSANSVKTYSVRESGTMHIPHIGDVVVAGKTCYQAAQLISAELQKEHFNRATVIMVLDSSHKERQQHYWGGNRGGYNNQGGMYSGSGEYVTLYGQVGRQGQMNLPGETPMTITQAILRAGGFARFANTKKVKVHRLLAGSTTQRRTIIVDVGGIMEGDLNKDIPLKPNDVVIVSEKLINF